MCAFLFRQHNTVNAPIKEDDGHFLLHSVACLFHISPGTEDFHTSTWVQRLMSTRSSLSERKTVIVNQAKKYLLYIRNICRFVHFVVDFNRRYFFTRSSMSFISLFLVEPSHLILSHRCHSNRSCSEYPIKYSSAANLKFINYMLGLCL